MFIGYCVKHLHLLIRRAIIETSNIPALKDIKEGNLNCEFGKDWFKLVITPEDCIDKYVLWIQRTRETIIPEKSKFYMRKTKIYVALYKEVSIKIF